MARDTLPQTPRRSSRFQPIATTPSTQHHVANILECKWLGSPAYSRPANKELDFLPEERELMAEDDEEEELEAVFYEGFRLRRKTASYRGSKRMQIAKEATQDYRIGSTVMVETDIADLRKRPLSIGVIVAMWQLRVKGEAIEENPAKMYIRIHWFLRPTELAAVRAKREHEENELYYSLASKATITPATILMRCAVSGVRGNVAKGKEKAKPSYTYIPKTRAGPPTTPSKARPGSPLKKSTRFLPDSDSDEEEDETDDDDSKISSDPERNFYCRLAVDSRRGLFFDLNWDRHRLECLQRSKRPTGREGSSSVLSWGEGEEWDVVVAEKLPKKKEAPALEGEISESEVDDSDDEHRGSGTDSDDDNDMEVDDNEESEGDDDGEEPDEDPDEPRTPSRKRGRGQLKTPSKKARTLVQPTPHSKNAIKRRKRRKNTDSVTGSPKKKRRATFAIRNPEQALSFQASMSHLPKDPWLRAMHALHVGSRPDILPCREAENARVLRCVSELLEEGSGGCVYISGVPGTGKTATVHTVVKELKRMAQNSETNPFTYVEINGLKIPEPAAAYSLLWEGISGHDIAKEGHLRLSPKESLKALMRYFTGANRGPEGHACVVLMDELDQLVTSKQDVVYNFFNWPTLVGSKLVVIAVANTMDLPERVMTGRVRSRLGMIRINFQPYSRDQLVKIVQARLETALQSLEEDERADVVATDAITLAAMTVSRITGDARRVLDICRRAVELVKENKGTVKAPHIKEVVQVMQNTPTAAYLRDLSFHERLMLTSLVKCMKREGVDEIKWEDIKHQHLMYLDQLASNDDPRRKPTPEELTMVLDSLESSRAVVVEYGAAVTRKHSGERKVMLNIEQGEVEKVLSDVGGIKWRNVLGN